MQLSHQFTWKFNIFCVNVGKYMMGKPPTHPLPPELPGIILILVHPEIRLLCPRCWPRKLPYILLFITTDRTSLNVMFKRKATENYKVSYTKLLICIWKTLFGEHRKFSNIAHAMRSSLDVCIVCRWPRGAQFKVRGAHLRVWHREKNIFSFGAYNCFQRFVDAYLDVNVVYLSS